MRAILVALVGVVASQAQAGTAILGTERLLSKLPADLRAAYVQARQNEAGPDYQVTSRGAQVVANNAAHRLAVTMDAQGVHLAEPNGSGLGSLRLVRAGCVKSPETLAAVAPQGQGTRVEYQRPGLTEWYLNGPKGLEQGFTVSRDPGCPRLALELQLAGDWTAKLVGFGDQAGVELQARKSGQRVYYRDLSAQDATNKQLATQLLLIGKTIRLEVDVTGAHYPINVDPMILTQQTLTGSDGTTQNLFGYSVALSKDTAVVGAVLKSVGTNMQQGQVYIYGRTGNTWTEQQKLTASDGGTNDYFGYAVSLSGDTAVISTYSKMIDMNAYQGEAYVYARVGTTWSLQQAITDSAGNSFEQFGYSVLVSGDTLFVGAPAKTVGTNAQQGQISVFSRSGTTWTEQTPIMPSDAAAQDEFGAAMALDGNTLVVSAPLKLIGTSMVRGQAYVFTGSGTTWTEQQALTASDGTSGDQYGIGVAVSGDTALVGSYLHGVGNPAPGQVYVYTRAGTTWTEQAPLVAADGAGGDAFGYHMAMNGTAILVGAPLKPSGSNVGQGAAYIFAPPLSANGVQCAVATDCLSNFCTDGVCCDTSCGGGDQTDCQSCLAVDSGGVDGTCAPIAAWKMTTCRTSAGICDIAEICDGTNPLCPDDQLMTAGTVCAAAPDASKLDALCSGTRVDCPTNLPAYEFSGGGLSSCAAAVPLGASRVPSAAGAAWAMTVLLLLTAARRRARQGQG